MILFVQLSTGFSYNEHGYRTEDPTPHLLDFLTLYATANGESRDLFTPVSLTKGDEKFPSNEDINRVQQRLMTACSLTPKRFSNYVLHIRPDTGPVLVDHIYETPPTDAERLPQKDSGMTTEKKGPPPRITD